MWKLFIRISAILSLFVIAAFLTAAFVVLLVLNRGLPSIDSLKKYEPKEVSQAYSEHGEVVAEYYEERRFVARDIPDRIRQAFIAAEDNHFYQHRGVDFIGVFRAVYVNLTAGGLRQGGSTITQQVARGFLLSPEKSFSRKIKEMILAWQIESKLSKEEILFLYLNHIYLGHGAYGVAAAARTYFGKELNDVTLAEAAILAGLPKAPSKYSPAKNPDRVKRRQLYVLKQMNKLGFITDSEYEEASNQDVFVEPVRDINKTVAPYFVEYVRQYVMNKYGSRMVLEDGLKIYTTLDLKMDRYAQNALRKGLSDLEKRQGYRGPLKKLKPEEVKEYFQGRQFEERDLEGVRADEEAEVSASEAKGKGQIRMRPPKILEVGDWMEGVVQGVDDKKQQAMVEYAPGYWARLSFDDMKWAHRRVKDDDDDDATVPAVNKVSDVVSMGDVVVFTVKALNAKPGDPLEGQLEMQTEVEGALMSLDPRNGYVKAMVGGYDFNRSQFNRALQAKRQPGSAFKPIIYTAALDQGFTAASILQDSPIVFENAADQDKWRPSNYDQKFIGDTTLRNSLLASRNITTIRLLNEIGLETAVSYARQLGIRSPLNRDFTLALGSSVVTLDEILQPYIVFANGGYPKKPLFIKKIVDRYGKILEDNVSEDFSQNQIEETKQGLTSLKQEVAAVELGKSERKDKKKDDDASFLQEAKVGDAGDRQPLNLTLRPGQVLPSETSFLMSYLLKENVLYGTGRKARELDRPASGKTGTTDDNKDAWFIGFTPDMVTGVWVGYDDQRVLGKNETGSKAAVPIWLDYMSRATAPYPKSDFEVPANIEFARIDPRKGVVAGPTTKGAIFEAFVKGTVPTAQTTKPSINENDLYQRDR